MKCYILKVVARDYPIGIGNLTYSLDRHYQHACSWIENEAVDLFTFINIMTEYEGITD